MKIAVLGSGNIGGTIGRKWAAGGHEVIFGVRDVTAPKVQALLAATGHSVGAADVVEAVAGAEVMLLAIPGRAVADTVSGLGDALDGKIVIDATNRVGEAVMNSLDILRAQWPRAWLFRAFNNLGWENFEEPVIDDVQLDLFFCGDEGLARQVVEGLIAEVGLRPVYAGGLPQAELIDSLTRLWFALALQQGYGRQLGFKMVGGR